MTEQPTDTPMEATTSDPITSATSDTSVQVAVNLLWCVPGDVGGSEQYLVRQLLGLAHEDTEFTPRLYCLRSFVAAHPELAALMSMTAAPITGHRRPRRILAENTWLWRRTGGADIVHHGGGTTPVVGHHPIVLTVHDLQYLTHPQYLSPSKFRYLSWSIPRSVRRASVVAVPTEYVRARVIDAYGVAPDRVRVVPHGVEPTLGADAPSPADLRHRYGLGDGPVVILPAITHPHKGHRFLLDVMARHWGDPDLRLVLLGGRGTVDAEVMSDVERLGLGARVVRPGRVSDADRDGLIALADALVFPSEYEGFGAPVVEAMALGTPVICSDRAALPEVAGDAGLVLPLDVDAWAGALDLVSEHSDEMRAAGLQRATGFTARRSGLALADTYRAALDR